MRQHIKRTGGFIALFMFSTVAFGQTTGTGRYISLDQAVETAVTQNKNIQTAGFDQQLAEAGYRQTDAVFLPQLGISYSAMRTNNPMNAFGFKLQQQSITEMDFDPAQLNHPADINDVATSIDLKQPLFNADMIFMRQGARVQTELYKYKSLRTKEYIEFETEKAYLQIQLAYEAGKVTKEALETARRVLETTRHLFEQGLINKADLLQAQVHVSGMESQQLQSQNAIQNASDYLSFLMGEPSGIIYTVDPIPGTAETFGAVTNVPASRADFMAMQKAMEATGKMIKANKMSYLPRLNAFGSYQLHDKQLTGFGSDSYMAGIQLSWNIFEGNSRRFKLKSQQIQYDKLETQLASQKEQGQVELNKANRDLQEARFTMQQQKTAIEQAGEALRMLQNRYEQGLETTTDVLAAQTRLTQQKNGLAQSLFAIRLNAAYLKFLTRISE
jgi:outer membrane protein TolC